MEILFLMVLTVVLIGIVLASVITPRPARQEPPITMRAFERESDGVFVIELQRGDRTVENCILPVEIVTGLIHGRPYELLEAVARETRDALERVQEEPS